MNGLNIQIDSNSETPLGEQIYNGILRQILRGELMTGERLPTERELALSLGVARGTVKRAYTRLHRIGAIETRKGSGSYVLKNGNVLETNQKKESLAMIASTFVQLENLGITRREILNLINIYCEGSDGKESKMKIMVLSNNPGILGELEQQLSYLTDASLFFFTISFMTISSVNTSPDLEEMLNTYDLIIATCIDYPLLALNTPALKEKIIEVDISPATETLNQLSALSKDVVISVIYRTPVFRAFVRRSLVALGFSEKNIREYQEENYNPSKHSENGANVIINHNESPLYIDPNFSRRNKEFVKQGGLIMQFCYRISRKSLLYIEDRINIMLKENSS